MTGNQKKDLRTAWYHVDLATLKLQNFPTAHPGLEATKLEILQELSDARRLIDRVEQDRMP